MQVLVVQLYLADPRIELDEFVDSDSRAYCLPMFSKLLLAPAAGSARLIARVRRRLLVDEQYAQEWRAATRTLAVATASFVGSTAEFEFAGGDEADLRAKVGTFREVLRELEPNFANDLVGRRLVSESRQAAERLLHSAEEITTTSGNALDKHDAWRELGVEINFIQLVAADYWRVARLDPIERLGDRLARLRAFARPFIVVRLYYDVVRESLGAAVVHSPAHLAIPFRFILDPADSRSAREEMLLLERVLQARPRKRPCG